MAIKQRRRVVENTIAQLRKWNIVSELPLHAKKFGFVLFSFHMLSLFHPMLSLTSSFLVILGGDAPPLAEGLSQNKTAAFSLKYQAHNSLWHLRHTGQCGDSRNRPLTAASLHPE
jgi:hypothetical protein